MREAVEALAALAPSLDAAMATIRAKAFVILDGTLLPIDRIAADTPYYSGKHKRDGMNVQALTDPFGRLLWARPALPGSTHDLTAARQHGPTEALAGAGLNCWADKAYQGAGGPVRVPCRGRRLKRWKRRHNTDDAKIRCLGERAMATLKGWRLLRKLRCSTNRITNLVKAPSSSFTTHQREVGKGSVKPESVTQSKITAGGRCPPWLLRCLTMRRCAMCSPTGSEAIRPLSGIRMKSA